MANYIFSGQEIATAYAQSAERLFAKDVGFLKHNPAVIPILVSQLFHSLEISIKHAGTESGLFTEKEAHGRAMRSGHGIKEIAILAVKKLGGTNFDPLIMAITHFATIPNSQDIIRQMISGAQFEKTRTCYATRCFGYSQVASGDFAFIPDIPTWIASVKETAGNLPKTIDLLRQWLDSSQKPKDFAVWLAHQ